MDIVRILKGKVQPCSLKSYVLPQGFHYNITSPRLEYSITENMSYLF